MKSGVLGWPDLVREATFGLRTRTLRAVLSGLGIAMGIATMVAVFGLSESSRADLLAAIDRLGTNLLRVEPGNQLFGGAGAVVPDAADEMIRRIPPVQRVAKVGIVSDVSVRRTPYIDESETNAIAVAAADSSLMQTLGGAVRKGRFLDRATQRYPAVVLGSIAAERLGIVDLEGGPRVWISARWFAVVGILDPLPLAPEIDRSALVGWRAARTQLDHDGAPSTIYVRAAPDDVEDVRAVLARTANPENPEEIAIVRPSDALEARAAAKTAFTGLFLGLAAVALLVGGVGIANVMVISVLERRSEIGLRRALGATRRHIMLQFLTESLVLAVLGGLAGGALGGIVTYVYATSREWEPVVPLVGVAGGIVAALVVGVVAGLYPAVRAARMHPTDALRGV